MLRSHVIEVDGTFVGAAVRQAGGYRFVAVDLRLEELDGSIWPSLREVEVVARRLTLTGRLGPPAEVACLSAAHSGMTLPHAGGMPNSVA